MPSTVVPPKSANRTRILLPVLEGVLINVLTPLARPPEFGAPVPSHTSIVSKAGPDTNSNKITNRE